MLVKLVSKVEGVVTWGAWIDWKVDEATTSTTEMKAGLNMMLSMQKALAKKFSMLLLQKGICSPMNQCTRVKCNKGNNGQPQLEAYAKIQVVVVI